MISIIMPAYNRAHTIGRAVDSVLAQDYADWELIIVDDGSTDGTGELLGAYADPRIRALRHPVNRGSSAAKNTGLDALRGEWFTILDSDDEMVPDALSAFMRIPAEVDPDVTAITCNCIDTQTGGLSGSGFDYDTPVEPGGIFSRGRGEFWGLTKTSLLGRRRFNEDITGWESILWYALDREARRYYLHKALRLYHTEGHDRLSAGSAEAAGDDGQAYRTHCALLRETAFLAELRVRQPDLCAGILFSAGLLLVRHGRRMAALKCAGRLARCPGGMLRAAVLALGCLLGSPFLGVAQKIKNRGA